MFALHASDEDIHTAVERRLTELVGAVGGKLHTGRSRNDQVATDFRLWTLATLAELDRQIAALQGALIDAAEPHVETLMAGYTHMQPAQPITVAHWLMSYFWMLARDRSRLADARNRMLETPLDIDRHALAQELGFAAATRNSLDAVSDRDFAAEALFVMALIGVHLSRLAEDVIYFSNPAFGYITLDDRYSTGSSLMPQKRNADPMELARAKSGRLIGNLSGLLATLKGLPTGYNKDMQEDKEALFDAVDQLGLVLPVVTAIVRTLRMNPDRLRAALVDEMLATDLADYLVNKGMPFRQAHHAAGQAVKAAQDQGIGLSQLSVETLRAISPLFTNDVTGVFDFGQSVAARRAYGGTAPDAVREQIAGARQLLLGDL
jgi:argininosuccinate lyase